MDLLLATALIGALNYGATLPGTLRPQDIAGQVEDDTPAIPADPQPELSAYDRRFLTAAVEDNLVAIAALELLRARSPDETLQRFAGRTLRDRDELQQALEVLAIRKNLTLLRRIPRAAEATLNRLAGQSGKAFDRAWMREYGDLAQRAASRFAPAGRLAIDGEVRAFALEQAAVLHRHVEASDQAISACACGEAAPATAH